MFKKVHLLGLILIISSKFYAQERLFSSKKNLQELKTSTLQICVGDNGTTFERYLKFAIKKYWTFSPFEFVECGKYEKNKPIIRIDEMRLKTWTEYFYTKLWFTNFNRVSFECHFDNLTAKGECVGIDKSEDAIQFKTTIAIMNLNAQLKFHDSVYLSSKKHKWINDWTGFKGNRLAQSKILIPNEHLSNGVSKESFNGLGNFDFVSFQEINKRLDANDTKGYSVLVAYSSPMGRYFNIIDLFTGDFIYFYDFNDAFTSGAIGMPSKIDDKAVKQAIKELNK